MRSLVYSTVFPIANSNGKNDWLLKKSKSSYFKGPIKKKINFANKTKKKAFTLFKREEHK